MMTRRLWIITVLLPIFVVVGLDQITKVWANSVQPEIDFGLMKLSLLHNYGFMLGSFKGAEKLYTVVMPSTLGAFLAYVFVVVQYFLPFKFPSLRIGLSIFFAGVVSNILDRLAHGYVIDFLQIKTSAFQTGVFNLADVLQWIGVALFFVSFIKNGKILYPIDERRGHKWIDPKFQTKFCLTLVMVGFFFGLIIMALCYSFLDVSINSLLNDSSAADAFILQFVRLFAIVSFAFFVSLFIVGIQLSWRIAGPIRAFEGFIEDVLRGKQREFKLRSGDDFKRLESVAAKFHKNFHEALGMDPKPLEQTQRAPAFKAKTYNGKDIDLDSYRGRKVWLIFYRYATCPLCVMHLSEVKEVFKEIQGAGNEVIAVFETEPDDFLKEDTGHTTELLSSLSIPLISDPGREVYRLYRNRVNFWALFSLKTIKRLIQAVRNKFWQGEVDGTLGALPAHFLIDEEGVLHKASYSESMIEHIDLDLVRDFFDLKK